MTPNSETSGKAGRVDVMAVLEGASFMYRSKGMIDQAHGADLAKVEFVRLKEMVGAMASRTSDDQIKAWADRHDIFNGATGSHLSDARAALEDAQSISCISRIGGAE